MPTIREVREALALSVNGLEGIRSKQRVTDQVNAKQATVYRKAWTYDDVQHGPYETGASTLRFGVVLYAPRAAERASQDWLDDLAEPAGDTSLKQYMESDATLAALVDFVVVTDIDEVKVVAYENTEYLSEEFTVIVGIS
jgi:hypothetical protein